MFPFHHHCVPTPRLQLQSTVVCLKGFCQTRTCQAPHIPFNAREKVLSWKISLFVCFVTMELRPCCAFQLFKRENLRKCLFWKVRRRAVALVNITHLAQCKTTSQESGTGARVPLQYFICDTRTPETNQYVLPPVWGIF